MRWARWGLGVAALIALAGCGATVGDSCTTVSDCGGGNALCLNAANTPGGYCSKQCTAGDDTTCPHGSACINNGGGTGIPSCYRTCATQSDCRSGYQCTSIGGNPALVCTGT